MSPTPSAAESSLIDFLRPRLHRKLQPLFDQSNRCLPILQATCQQIMSLMGPDSSAVSLARIISRDHGLTCKVLQVANSIAYRLQQMITSVPHAVSWLELDTARSLVAAAHLVEQLKHWPERQQQLRTLIAKSLLSATSASELGAVLEYPQAGQLFTAALLYSVGDLTIAYQEPDLYQALQTIPETIAAADRVSAEIHLIGVPCLTLARALAQEWKLPGSLIELFAVTRELRPARWQSGRQTFQRVCHRCDPPR